MAYRTAQGRRFATALAAAVLLWLQALFGAFAGAQAATVPRDVFGNPLCITSAAHEDGGSRHDPAAMPGCCTLACQAPVPLLPGGAAATLAIAGTWTRMATPLPHAPDLARHDGHRPGNPRAPPVPA